MEEYILLQYMALVGMHNDIETSSYYKENDIK